MSIFGVIYEFTKWGRQHLENVVKVTNKNHSEQTLSERIRLLTFYKHLLIFKAPNLINNFTESCLA